MDLVKALKLEALANVICDGDGDYQWRYLRRWYSKTFHTPLADTVCIPMVDILRAYFEEKYEDMDEDHLEEERLALTETAEEARAKLRAKVEDVEDADDFVKEVEAMEQERLAKAGLLARPVSEMSDMGPKPKPQKPPAPFRMPEVELPTPVVRSEPTIKLSFADLESFDRMDEGIGGCPGTRRRPPDRD